MPAQVPTVFVVFGATGDLMEKKIAPALYGLFQNKKLPPLMKVVGVGRRDWDNLSFREYISSLLRTKYDPDTPEIPAFASIFDYHKGVFEDKGLYSSIINSVEKIESDWGVGVNILYYLAVPPIHYKTIAQSLSDSGLVGKGRKKENGYSRIIIEKPFGYDENTHKELESFFENLFDESQIYRIDHYLGKQMFQNLLAFRFSNALFEGIWSSKYISKIEIKILEKGVVGDRGQFYDGLGALRDVGQNHILQMLSVVTMDRPNSFEAEFVRRERAKILGYLPQCSPETSAKRSYRAQYESYRSERDVKPDSQTETYFKILTELTHPSWQGVPITLEAGKGMPEDKKEIVITFKEPVEKILKDSQSGASTMLFKLSPQESIEFDLWSKEVGYEMKIGKKRFKLNERKTSGMQYIAEYEHLLLAACSADQTYFVSKEETINAWKFIDPFICSWESGLVPLSTYKVGETKPREESKSAIFSGLPLVRDTYQERKIGLIGLGKMGRAIADKLSREGWLVEAWNRSRSDYEQNGVTKYEDLRQLVNSLPTPRVVWLMLPSGDPTTNLINELLELLSSGDIIVNGANEHPAATGSLRDLVNSRRVEYVDVGVSGGPGVVSGIGGSIMVGGPKNLYEYLWPLYKDLAQMGGVVYCGPGGGHFVKMVHNGIEYGMMQALAEGLTMLPSEVSKIDVLNSWMHGSVVEGRLVAFAKSAFEKYGEKLEVVSGRVDALGEGQWAAETAEKMGTPNWAIKAAVDFRKQSQDSPSFTGKVLSGIRGQFGGHSVIEKKDGKTE
jgi:glucose-6-phosphate 1-dehydrogenase